MSALFKRNNHSTFRISYRATTATNRHMMTKLLERYYDFNQVNTSSVGQVDETENASNNFRISVVLRNGLPITILLRKNIRVSRKRELELLEKTLLFLSSRGIPVPEMIKTKGGGYHCQYKGYLWQVYKFISGNHYSGTTRELLSCARGIASLHQTLRSFPYRALLEQRKHFLPSWNLQTLEHIHDYAAKRKETDIDHIFFKNRSFLIPLARETRWHVRKIKRGRTQIIHGDLHPHNLICSQEKLTAILDFEMIQRSELLRDVGFALHRLVRQFAVLHDSGIRGVREGYQKFIQSYSAIIPLSKHELRHIPHFIRDELLRRITKDFYLYYFKKDARFASSQELQKKIILLKEAEYFF